MNIESLARLVIVLPLAGASLATAAEWDLTGFTGIDSRAFSGDGRYPGQHSGSDMSLTGQAEFYWRGDDRARFAAVVYGRADSEDRERSHVDLREANFGYLGDGWDLNVGVGKVFWGITESRHLVDVINQTDLVEDIDEEHKLGQPMVNLNLDKDFGRFEFYVLPRFRERTFPGPNGRLRGPLPIDEDAAIFESTDGKRHRDVSFRYSHYFGDFDIGAYLFDGTAREPRLEPNADATRLVPVYEQMQQAGLDLQFTRGSWLWKLETIARQASSDSFQATVAGVEYTFFGARGSGADVGVLFEHLYDGRDTDAPATAFDNDAFIGMRLAFNDANDTSLLAGAAIDLDTRETFVTIETERRFGNSLKIDARLRLFGSARPGEATYPLQRDDYVEIALSWYY